MTQAFNLSQLANKVNTSGQLDVATGVTGTLPIANGGTNNTSLAVTAGGVLYTDGSKIVNVGVGTSGQALLSNGASAPSWGSSAPGAGSITDAMLSTIGAGSFIRKYPWFSSTLGISSTGNATTFSSAVKIGRNISIQFSGSYSFSFSQTNQNTSIFVYKNGVNAGTLVSINNGGSGGPFTGSLTAVTVDCSIGDVLALYFKAAVGNTGSATNLAVNTASNVIPFFGIGTSNINNIA